MIKETKIGKIRREAKEQGLSTFFTGIPCKYGHLAPRRTSNYTCLKCSLVPEENKKKLFRKEAKAKGLKRYFTGIPCHKGHIAERMTSDGQCTKCWLIPEEEKKTKRKNKAGGLRKEAKEKGLKFYFTGVPCAHGHISKRRTSDSTCL